jgi:hypothetical protein
MATKPSCFWAAKNKGSEPFKIKIRGQSLFQKSKIRGQSLFQKRDPEKGVRKEVSRKEKKGSEPFSQIF